MAEAVAPIFAFNRGLISKLGLARTDLKRQALSAEIQTNWMPRVLGSMMLRPGFGYIGSTLGNAKAKHLDFVFATDDTAIIELTDGTMRVLVNEKLVTRVAVATTISNGAFTSNLNGWIQNDQAAASSYWASGSGMGLLGTEFNAAIRYQQLSIAGSDINKEHALSIVIALETATLRVGTSLGADDLVNETTITVGNHSIAFTPTGSTVYVQLSNANNYPCTVKSVAIAPAGVMTLPTIWPLAALSSLRYDQSGDEIFIACDGYVQQRIERRSLTSWSVVSYLPQDGPFLLENIGPIQLSTSGTLGSITLSASAPLFKPGHVNALFMLASIGQHASITASGTSQWSGAVQVSGVQADRNIVINISGTFSATVVLQRSVGAPGAWEDVSGESWTAGVSTTFNDTLDNQDMFYRIGIETTHASGSAVCTLDTSVGSITGVVRVNSYVNAIQVGATVLTQPNNQGVLQGLGSTNATPNWWEGQWSDVQGYPTSVVFYQGRLWWFGRGNVVGSASDAYASFDQTITGDSMPINRTIGSGPVDVINWGLPLQRLILGSQGKEISVRSDSLDDPLTNSNFNLKDASTQGSMGCAACKIDNNGIFADRSTRRIYQLNFNWTLDGVDYSSTDLTNFCPDLALQHGGIVMLAVQRKPDTRIHAVFGDGTVGVMVYDLNEEEHCWVLVQTAGIVEDVIVLPSTLEDRVYYTVNRTINGQTVRYLEKWAREDECWGNPVGKLADAFTYYSGAATQSVTGLTQLIGASVVAWGWNTVTPFTVTKPDGTVLTVGRNLGTYTVSNSGTITGLPVACTDIVVGLPYTGQFKSAKLAYAAKMGTALTQPKKQARLGLICANMHAQGLSYGPDFNTLDSLPQFEHGAQIDQNMVWDEYDTQSKPFPGKWDSDSRLCLQAQAPLPVTVLAAIVDMQTNERV